MKPGSGKRFNRLIHEGSPYLLQHADNPVDWYPWGNEAFREARKRNLPIFLSIGYSTCHWCHVMEKECFSDSEVAALLNSGFVCIKVDREERPDIDEIYMKVAVMLSGRGGWPLSVIMTPEKEPFFVGTYFPKLSEEGMPGLLDVLPRISTLWQEERENILESAGRITDHLALISQYRGGDVLRSDALDLARSELENLFDAQNGGFGTVPKFPAPHNLFFLLRMFKTGGDKKILAMVEHTLQKIRAGGIYDHLSGGFHRYSTDAAWRDPHFEKMLTDQALNSMAYTEAFLVTGNELYSRTSREILKYVEEKLTSKDGGFFSGEDADSEGAEGRFYAWTENEIRRILGMEDAVFFFEFFSLGNLGNLVAGRLPGGEETEKLARLKSLLEGAMNERPRPFLDNKVITASNGLMIAAFAKAASAFDSEYYGGLASKAARFILSLADGDDLKRIFCDGNARIDAQLDDYAFMVWGLIELYEYTFDPFFLERAAALNRRMLERFWDKTDRGLFMTGKDDLVVRARSIHDMAAPSGNSVATLNLLRLSRFLGDDEFVEYADMIFDALAQAVRSYPSGCTHLLSALDFRINPVSEISIAGNPAGEVEKSMIRELRKRFLPRSVSVFYPKGDKRITCLAPTVPDLDHAGPCACVCIARVCGKPVATLEEFSEVLDRI